MWAFFVNMSYSTLKKALQIFDESVSSKNKNGYIDNLYYFKRNSITYFLLQIKNFAVWINLKTNQDVPKVYLKYLILSNLMLQNLYIKSRNK